MLIEVFKTGKHKDADGTETEWTSADLEKIAEQYNGGEHEAPVVIGHPEDNKPAYGWVKSLSVEGDKLMAELHEMQPEFVEWVNAKLFKKRSISVYPDGTLRHVGFLGALPPAVKGLKDFKFKEGCICKKYEYEDNETESKEENTMTLEELMKQVKELQEKMAEMTAKLAATEKERDEAKANAVKAEEEKKTTAAEFADAKRKQAKADLTQFCDSLVADKRLLPAQKQNVIAFASILAEQPVTMDFADGGKKTLVEGFKALLGELPKHGDLTLDFSDTASNNKPQPTETIKRGQV